jgi:hypothetical protein
MNQNKYYVINCFFANWRTCIPKYADVQHVTRHYKIPNQPDHKIILLDVNDRFLYGWSENAIFKMDMSNIDILNNKCLFAKYMMEHFPDNIPTTISIYTKTINYLNPNVSSSKMIEKDAVNYAGRGISIIKALKMRKINTVVSEYINHNEYYSGHFLIYKGEILKNIFFKGSNDDPNLIRKGPITSYQVVESNDMQADMSVFEKLFKDLNYSGFACPEFTIVDKKIVMFEINPRPGGSLIANEKYCKEFFQEIIDRQISD